MQPVQEQLEIPEVEDDELPGFDEIEENGLPGFDEIEENELPGFDEIEENELPGFDEEEEEEPQERFIPRGATRRTPTVPQGNNLNSSSAINRNNVRQNPEPEEDDDDNFDMYNLGGNSKSTSMQASRGYSEDVDLSKYLTKDKKVVAFIGTSKAGTSFLVNNVADYIAKSGIKTAILDVTTNRNAYYIYTKNEEPLRKKIVDCLESLEQNIVDGINVSKNLTVFTSIPGKTVNVENVEAVIAALVKQFSLVIIDCDFNTPKEYFEFSQEIYLIQNMDILTIQPLTAFLRDLQAEDALDPAKLKVVLNQAMKIRGLSMRAIIGGLSCYNDPEMSYMKTLFDKDKIPAISISFDYEVLTKYLSGMVDCIVTVNGYSRHFMSELKSLADMVYPLINGKGRIDYTKNNKFANNAMENSDVQNNFSNGMNNTLDKMKSQYK